MSVIKPTIGRVLYYRRCVGADIQVAIIVRVHADNLIDIALFDVNGVPFTNPPSNIRLLQGDDKPPATGGFCEWMPYQKETAVLPTETKDSVDLGQLIADAVANEVNGKADRFNEVVGSMITEEDVKKIVADAIRSALPKVDPPKSSANAPAPESEVAPEKQTTAAAPTSDGKSSKAKK